MHTPFGCHADMQVAACCPATGRRLVLQVVSCTQRPTSDWDRLCPLLQGSRFFGGVCRQNAAIAAPPRGQSFTCGIAVTGASACTGMQILPGVVHQRRPCWLSKLTQAQTIASPAWQTLVTTPLPVAHLCGASTCTGVQMHSCSAMWAAGHADSKSRHTHRLWYTLHARLQQVLEWPYQTSLSSPGPER